MPAARSTLRRGLAFGALVGCAVTGCGGEHRGAFDPNDRGAWRYGGGAAGLPIVRTAPSGTYVPPPVDRAPRPAVDAAGSPTGSNFGSPSRTNPTASMSSPSASTGTYKIVEVKDGGSIHVVCRLSNAPKELETVVAFKHKEFGCTDHKTERCRFAKKGDGDLRLGGCKISLKGVRAGKDWPAALQRDDRAYVIDQKACVYMPHNGWTRPITQVVVANSDRAEHNIHGNFGSDTKFNFGSEPGTRKENIAEAYLENPGTYVIKCDIHPWMNAFIHLSPHPYVAITPETDGDGGLAGEATIEGVPPGTYEIVCWHEGMLSRATEDLNGIINGYVYSPEIEVERPVTITAKGRAEVEFAVPYQ